MVTFLSRFREGSNLFHHSKSNSLLCSSQLPLNNKTFAVIYVSLSSWINEVLIVTVLPYTVQRRNSSLTGTQSEKQQQFQEASNEPESQKSFNCCPEFLLILPKIGTRARCRVSPFGCLLRWREVSSITAHNRTMCSARTSTAGTERKSLFYFL